MKIGNVTLNITPTSDNYQMTPLIIGTFERTISGELKALNVSTAHTWRLEFYILDQVADFVALAGESTTFTDYDDAEYDVMVTGFGPVTGYPRADRGRCYITIEEIWSS